MFYARMNGSPEALVTLIAKIGKKSPILAHCPER